MESVTFQIRLFLSACKFICSFSSFFEKVRAAAEILGCAAIEFGPRQGCRWPVPSWISNRRAFKDVVGNFLLLLGQKTRQVENPASIKPLRPRAGIVKHNAPPENPGRKPSRAGKRTPLVRRFVDSCAVAVNAAPGELAVAIFENSFSLLGARYSSALIPRFDGAGTYFPAFPAVFVCLCSRFAL